MQRSRMTSERQRSDPGSHFISQSRDGIHKRDGLQSGRAHLDLTNKPSLAQYNHAPVRLCSMLRTAGRGAAGARLNQTETCGGRGLPLGPFRTSTDARRNGEVRGSNINPSDLEEED